MSADRRTPRDHRLADDEATAIRPREGGEDQDQATPEGPRVPVVSFDPRGVIPKLPAAFVGRRRFSARPPPEPEPVEDPIAKARAWGPDPEGLVEIDATGSEEQQAWPYAEEAVKAFLSPPEPAMPSTPDLVEVTEDPPEEEAPIVIGVEGASSGELLPRLPVAGAVPLATGIELPDPTSEARWPTETPPPSSPMYARGAEDSLQPMPAPEAGRRETWVSPTPASTRPKRSSSAKASPKPAPAAPKDRLQVDLSLISADERLGHTLQPKDSLEGLVDAWPPAAPPTPPPRPAPDGSAPYSPRPRPDTPAQASSTPLTQQPVPSPLRNPTAYEDESTSLDIDDPVGFDADSEGEDDAEIAVDKASAPERPGVASFAALGCFAAFLALVAAAALGFAAATLALQ